MIVSRMVFKAVRKVEVAGVDITAHVKRISVPIEVYDDVARKVEAHIWSQGPGPYSPQDYWMERLPDIEAYCGEPVRVAGRWLPIGAVTAEFIQHHPDEEARYCAGCLRVLAARPTRCSAGAACTGTLLCRG